MQSPLGVGVTPRSRHAFISMSASGGFYTPHVAVLEEGAGGWSVTVRLASGWPDNRAAARGSVRGAENQTRKWRAFRIK